MDASSTELDRRTRQQEVVAELGQRALETDDIDQLLQDAAAAVADTLDAAYCDVVELLPDGDEALLRAGVGWRDGLVGSATVATTPDTQTGYTLVSETPVTVENVRYEQRFSGSDLLADHDVAGGISAVVGPNDDPWGVFGVHTTEPREFAEHDVTFVQSVANVLASGIASERAESELEDIYGRISEAFFALDEEFRFTHLNERAHELINPDERTLVGKRVWDEFPDAIGRKFEERYWYAMREQETVSFEEYYPEPLDTWFEVRAYPSETGLSVHFWDVTERKRAQQALEDERDMFAEGPATVFRWAAEDGWPVEYVSRNVEDVFGYTAEELESGAVSYADLLLDEEIDRIAREVAANSDETTERFSHEPYRIETKDGDVKWVQDTTKILRDESGDISHRLGYLVDITDRKQREEELQREQRRFEAIFEDPNILVGLLDPDGTVRDINQTAMEYVDADLEDVTGELFWETPWWGEGDDVADDVREWTERAASGEYVDFEADLTRPGGERYVLNGVFRPVTNEAGDVVSVIVSDRDVTERREYERRLAESEQRYRALAENFPNGVVTLFDHDLRYTLAAGQAFEDFPFSPAEVEGQRPPNVWGEDIAAELEPVLRDALDGESGVVELSYLDREWAIYAVPITDEDGDVFAGMTMAQDITEQAQREQALDETIAELQESEERLRLALEAGQMGTWELDPRTGDAPVRSPQHDRIFGYEEPLDDWNVEAFLSHVHPDDREMVEQRFDEAVETGDWQFECRILRADGEQRWISVQGELYFEGGEPARVVGVVQDTTGRKEREHELERALDLLDKAERIADLGGWEIDTETMDVFWTDHIFELLEVPDDEEPSLDAALDMYHEADRPDVEAAIEDALAAGESFDVEARIRTHTGEIRWLRLQGVPEVEDGDVVSLRGTAQDTTERKEREEELERRARQQQVVSDLGQSALQSDDLDELMYETAREVADVLDVDYCKVLDLDQGAEELLLRQGVGWQDGIAGSATVSAVEDDSQAAYTLASEQPVVVDDLTTETRFSGPDLLTDHDVRSGISTIIGSFDDPWGILGAHDTERRTFTEEDVNFLQTVANVLAEAVKRDQYETELEQLVADLEESNERLEQFAYAASHDLQEPLRMVSSYLQLIERRYTDELDAEGEEFIDFAVDGADRMRGMIEGLLEYSRVDSRGNPLESVALDSVLANVLDDLQVRIEETDAEITYDSLPTVEGDASQLRQVFQNLLDNAIEYRGDDPPRIDISAERNGDEWLLSVHDEGIGIDPEDADRVFEVFQSLHTQTEHPGTGIGLALCERIVERHGGEIWVASEPGAGTTFSFTLPHEGTYSE